jgi:hypothetical protein
MMSKRLFYGPITLVPNQQQIDKRDTKFKEKKSKRILDM